MTSPPPEALERQARLCHSNAQAAKNLGMHSGSTFARACRRNGIETPNERKARQWSEQRSSTAQ